MAYRRPNSPRSSPIPWVHVHELEGPQVERLGLLSQHIADFHARDVSWGSTSLDWHSHLVLPWCMSHQHDCPANDEREPGADDVFGGTALDDAKIECRIGRIETRVVKGLVFFILSGTADNVHKVDAKFDRAQPLVRLAGMTGHAGDVR